MSTQLRLLSGAGLMAVAAALFLIFGRGDSPSLGGDPSGDPNAGGGDVVAGVGADVGDGDVRQGPDAPAQPGILASPWTVDFGGLVESEVLAAVLIDGAAMDSMAALEASLATAKVIDVGELNDRDGGSGHGNPGGGIRIRHSDEFVLDLASGTSLELQYSETDRGLGGGLERGLGGAAGEADTEPSLEPGTVLFAHSGAVRVATGPGFDGTRPLVLRTPHVRTQVVGTIYGVDIGDGYTCVCCLKGSVIADPCHGEFPALTVPELGTRVLLASGERPQASPLYGPHRGPLDALEGYWL